MRTPELAGPFSGKEEIDPFLEAERIIVRGTDADLNAVVLRLLRKEKLEQIAIAYLPTGESAVPVRARPETASTAAAVRTPLIRDDHGGVLVGAGSLEGSDVTVYCDSQLLLRRETARIQVSPHEAGVAVTVHKKWRRTRRTNGRAVQFGCAPTQPVADNLPYARPVERWCWYRHLSDLWLVAT